MIASGRMHAVRQNAESFLHAPETCPWNHWNRGDDICADCGADLSTTDNGVATPRANVPPSFRDQLSSTMHDTLAFEYFEVRPCIERDRQVTCYRDEGEFAAELSRSHEARREFHVFWSLYGVDRNATIAIGDFVSKDAAHEVMNAILAIPGARAAGNGDPAGIEQAARLAADWLDDMINQSSNDQRI